MNMHFQCIQLRFFLFICSEIDEETKIIAVSKTLYYRLITHRVDEVMY